MKILEGQPYLHHLNSLVEFSSLRVSTCKGFGKKEVAILLSKYDIFPIDKPCFRMDSSSIVISINKQVKYSTLVITTKANYKRWNDIQRKLGAGTDRVLIIKDENIASSGICEYKWSRIFVDTPNIGFEDKPDSNFTWYYDWGPRTSSDWLSTLTIRGSSNTQIPKITGIYHIFDKKDLEEPLLKTMGDLQLFNINKDNIDDGECSKCCVGMDPADIYYISPCCHMRVCIECINHRVTHRRDNRCPNCHKRINMLALQNIDYEDKKISINSTPVYLDLMYIIKGEGEAGYLGIDDIRQFSSSINMGTLSMPEIEIGDARRKVLVICNIKEYSRLRKWSGVMVTYRPMSMRGLYTYSHIIFVNDIRSRDKVLSCAQHTKRIIPLKVIIYKYI